MQTTTSSLSRLCAIHLFGALMLSVIITASATRALAQNQLIASVGLMEDTMAALRVEDMVRTDFQPVGNTISLGYSPSAIWLRLRILPAPDGGEVVLLFSSAVPDSLKLFGPLLAPIKDNATGFDPMHLDEMLPGWPSPMPGYLIAPPEGGADYFVRVQSRGSISLHMMARPVPEAIVTVNRMYVTQITYLTCMLVVMFWALQMFTRSRMSLFGWLAALQFVWFGNNIFYLGFAGSFFPFLSHETQMLLFRSSVFLGAFLSVVSHRAVMISFEPSWLALRLFDAQLGVIGLAFVSFWTFNEILALQINAACLSAMPIVFLVNAVSVQKNTAPGLVLMRFFYGLLSLSFIFNSLAILGLIESDLAVRHGYLIHGALTSTIFVLLLNAKARDMSAKAHEAQIEYDKIERNSQIEIEKTRVVSQFIEMLGHEAKNSLAVIKMSMPSRMLTQAQYERAEEAIQGLTNVIARCNQVMRLDKNEEILLVKACDLSEILKRQSVIADDSGRIILKGKGSVVIHCDRALLEVVFSNLLDNALKYAPSDSEIYVSLTSEDGGHSILFENAQGPAGMPDPERVFEKYYRSAYAKADIGSGLGLYLVRGLVHLMGGSVDYLPDENNIRFKVWFPC